MKKIKHNYYIKHKEKLKGYYRKYYQSNRDSILAKKKIYNDKNKERIKDYRRNYWLDNWEQLKIKHREYHRSKRKNGIQMSQVQ